MEMEERNKTEEKITKMLKCIQDKESQNEDFKWDHKELSEAEGPTVDKDMDWTPGFITPQHKPEE